MRPQPLICVRDVEASTRWYQRLQGLSKRTQRSRVRAACFAWATDLAIAPVGWEHHHGPIGDPNMRPYGNGVLLWFELDDFDAAVDRAEEMQIEMIQPRHRNPPSGDSGPNHW